MKYRILVSTNGCEVDRFYTEDKSQADLLFNMAVESKMFSYVELAEAKEEYIPKRDWEEGVDTE